MASSGNVSLLWSVFGHRIRRYVLRLVVIGVVFFLLLIALEIPFAPWIRSFGLWSTLTGRWLGEVQMPDGRTTPVYFDIDGRLGKHGSYIAGTAKWCEGRDRVRDYEVSGDSDNWRGTLFHLSTRPVDEGETGMALGELQGERMGDEIRAVGVMVSRARTATATATRDSRREDPPQPRVRYRLRRGSERDFIVACGGPR
jgi:hypothetical protein